MFHFGHSHHYEPGIRGQNISESSGLWFLSSAGHFCVLNIIYFSFKTSDPQVRSLDGTVELCRMVKVLKKIVKKTFKALTCESK